MDDYYEVEYIPPSVSGQDLLTFLRSLTDEQRKLPVVVTDWYNSDFGLAHCTIGHPVLQDGEIFLG